MAYRTKEQMEEETRMCKALDIEDVAKYMGFSIYHKGNSTGYAFIRDREGLVLFKKTNTFKDFYNDKSGTVIDLVMNEMGLSFKDSIAYLTSYAGIDYDMEKNSIPYAAPVTPVNKGLYRDEVKEFILPDKNTDYRRVYAYLTKSRMIDYETVNSFVKEGLLYEDKVHHNAVFVANDKNGVPRHAFLRGTLTDPSKRFRGDVSGSDKNYGFARDGSKDNTLLVVFEAPIDLMSFVSLTRDHESHLLALGMLDIAPVYKYIEEHPEVHDVTFILDNDKWGIRATSKFENELSQNGISVVSNNVTESLMNHSVKDMNELLVKIRSKKINGNEVEEKTKSV